MKIKSIIFSVLTLFASSCEEANTLRPFGPDDTTPPNAVTDIVYKAIPGGAIFKYTLPKDQDLAYVQAVYNVNEVKKDMVASQYMSELKIEGLPEKKEYQVELYAVDKSGNKSEPVQVTIIPEESPVKVTRESLKVTADFGGFKIDYKNPSQSELSLYIYQKDSESDNMIFYEARVVSQKEGTYQVIGLPNKTNTFSVFVRDRFENTSESLIFEERPWHEEYLDKKNFKYVGKPRVIDESDWYAWSGNPACVWDDIVGQWNFSQTASGDKFPHFLCIDLGVKVPIGRILFQQRLGDQEIFNMDCPQFFEIYGAAELPIVNPDDPLEGWTRLNKETLEVIRPSGRHPGEPPTTEDREAAEKGIMFTIDTPFPRPEIRYIRFKFLKSFTDRSMIILGEFTFWAQWK